MKTYNKAIFMPQDKVAKIIGKTYNLNFSSHAMLSCINDKYGIIKPPKVIKIIYSMIIELTINEFNNPIKALLRSKYDESLDLCLVVIPDNLQAIVKTLWLCKSTDNHSTLSKEVFAIN